jgi:hypothetical protein
MHLAVLPAPVEHLVGDRRLSVEVLLNRRQDARGSVVRLLVVLCSRRSYDDRPAMPLEHEPNPAIGTTEQAAIRAGAACAQF